MNFYQHQDRARRRTALLVGAFLLAIAGIALALNAAVYFAVSQSNEPPVSLAQWLEQPYWWWISAGVAAVILSGSLHTTFKLRDGALITPITTSALLLPAVKQETAGK